MSSANGVIRGRSVARGDVSFMNDTREKRAIGTKLGVVLLLGALLFAAAQSLRAPPWTVDDAFITARYADHLAHSGVFAYNLQGPRVEGITSPLFAFIGALASLGGISPIAGMKAFGIAAYVASGVLVFAMARELRLPVLASGVFVWLYIAIPEHVTHATSGLETEAFMASELACMLALMRYWRAPNKAHARGLVFAALVACLLRPEGLAIAVVACGVAVLRVRRRRRDRISLVRAIAFGLGLPLAVGLAARAAYFHSLLPNTFYAKTRGSISAEHLRDLASLATDYLLDVIVVGIALVLIAWLVGVRRGRVGPRGPMLVLASLAILAAFSLAYGHKDVMNYSRRFAMHSLPWLVTITLVMLSFAASRLVRLRRRHGVLAMRAALALAVTFVAALWIPRRELNRDVETQNMLEHIRIRRDWYEPARAKLVARAELLGRTQSFRLAVYPDAGYVPYRTDFETIDFGRLNDRHLSREVRSSQEVVDYFFQSAPDAVIFSHYGPDRMWNEDAKRVIDDPRFAEYTLARQWRDFRGQGISLYFQRTPAGR